MKKHLLLVGGGHAHMTAILNLDRFIERGHRVTLISPDAYHYYSGMGPGMLSGLYRPQGLRFNIRKMAEDRGASFVEDKVLAIDSANRILHLAGGGRLRYDVASFNVGSDIPTEIPGSDSEHVVPVKPIANLLDLRQRILSTPKGERLNLAVIGGGPAGVEMAGNLWRLAHDGGVTAHITLVAGSGLLHDHPLRVRRLAAHSLWNRAIRIIEGVRAHRIDSDMLHLSDGSEYPSDFVVLAVGVKPNQIFTRSGLPTGEDGGLLVNSYLQSISQPELFGGGDAISLDGHRLEKVGVQAVRQNPILFHNLMAALEGRPMLKFKPSHSYMLILNMGDGTGILWKNGWVWGGRLALALKGFIDNGFVRKYQVSGELEEAR